GDKTNAVNVSCPTQTQCTALVHDANADGGAGATNAVTFDPSSGAVGGPVALRYPDRRGTYESLSCPSASQCTAMGTNEITFDPNSGATRSSAFGCVYQSKEPCFQSNARVDCPSVTQCTAVSSSIGYGASDDPMGSPQRARELTFDPTTGTANAAGIVDLGTLYVGAVSCPTVSGCAAGVGGGEPGLKAFDPSSGSTAAAVGVVAQPSDMVCPSASLCVLVTLGGKVLGYDPSTGAHRTIGTVSSGSGGSAAAVLGRALVPSGAAATIGAILKAGAYPATVSAPGPGTAGVTWYYVPQGAHVASTRKPIVVASGTKTFKKAGKAKLKIKLSSAGRKMLKAAKKSVALTSKGTFTPKSGKRVSSKRTFKLKR
ncbi:MAG: hypothetical protein QOD53_1826, partial [Thermoleophilaceae bacterium]|nr:hypothetical protein [Thermoleophilaceae bacterium]